MTDKDLARIVYDNKLRILFLFGSFLPDIVTFQNKLSDAIYCNGSYDKISFGELKKPRVFRIVMTNCPGGVVNDVFCIVGIMRLYKQKFPQLEFHLHCIGCIQSAATIFMASEVFSRISIDRYCTLRIHNVQTLFAKEASVKRGLLVKQRN